MKAYQHIKADNDPVGNPQRLFVIYEYRDSGSDRYLGYWETVEVIDEGYGDPPRLPELPPVKISKAEYHARIRAAKERGILRHGS